jgi:hypothetical protein
MHLQTLSENFSLISAPLTLLNLNPLFPATMLGQIGTATVKLWSCASRICRFTFRCRSQHPTALNCAQLRSTAPKIFTRHRTETETPFNRVKPNKPKSSQITYIPHFGDVGICSLSSSRTGGCAH